MEPKIRSEYPRREKIFVFSSSPSNKAKCPILNFRISHNTSRCLSTWSTANIFFRDKHYGHQLVHVCRNSDNLVLGTGELICRLEGIEGAKPPFDSPMPKQ